MKHGVVSDQLDYMRRTLPSSYDVRDRPQWELLRVAFWVDDQFAPFGSDERIWSVGGGMTSFLFSQLLSSKDQRGGGGAQTFYQAGPLYLVRSGTVFHQGRVAAEGSFLVREELFIQEGDYLQEDNPQPGVANFSVSAPSAIRPDLRAYAMYEIPAGDYTFGTVPSVGELPVVYAVTRGTGAFRTATNVVVRYDPVSTEREVAIVRGAGGA